MKLQYILPVILLLSYSVLQGADDQTIVVHGEYPAISELNEGRFVEERASESEPLISYDNGTDYKEKAFIAAIHFLSANIYGYTFFYQPSSKLMQQEEVFELELKGNIQNEQVFTIGEGVYNNLYRVKVEFRITPSVEKWLGAFHSNNLRLIDADGTSEFYTGFSGRSDAYRDALKNLVTRYELIDTVVNDAVGEFTNPAFADLYDKLVKDGEISLEEALKVGVSIEELDIVDLEIAMEDDLARSVSRVFENLLAGSQNHLSAFQNAIETGTADGWQQVGAADGSCCVCPQCGNTCQANNQAGSGGNQNGNGAGQSSSDGNKNSNGTGQGANGPSQGTNDGQGS